MVKILSKNLFDHKGKHALNPYLVMAIAIICISFGSIFSKMSDAPAIIIAAYRLGFSSLLLLPFIFGKSWQEFKSIKSSKVLWALLSGLFLALHFATWVSSLKYITVSSSVVLVALQPVFVAVGSYLFLKEKIPIKALLAGLIALSGTFLIGAGDLQIGSKALWGDFLAISGAVFAAAYWIVGRSLRQSLSVTTYTFLVYTTSAVILFGFAYVQSIPLLAYDIKNWVLFFALAIVPTLGGHSLFNWSLGYVQSIVVSISILGEAVGATILAYFIFGEAPTFIELFGGIVILLGLYLFIINNKQ
ncbi:DMT family transporter [Bacillota bacterium LX-D]|nr:DMT family transporter [Bacillota bacterium LX-D]